MPAGTRSRLLGSLVGLLGALFVACLLATPAHADGEAIGGTLRTLSGEPVAGVTITVTSTDGFDKSAVTDEKGLWNIPVPKPGPYTVELDGVHPPRRHHSPRIPTPSKPPPTQAPRDSSTSTWACGHETSSRRGTERPQLTVEGLRFGLVLALAAVGLSMIYGTTGLTNFAHGELITFGALIAYTLNVSVGIPLLLAGILGSLATGLFGFLQDRLLWFPLRKRGTGLVAMMIVSIGLALVLRNVYLIFYGGARCRTTNTRVRLA